jgi:hypothetical protein
MELRAHHSWSLLAAAIVVFLLAFSFNAYACLVPLFGVPQVAMGGGCTGPQNQPVRQFCDAFMTLGVHSADEFHLPIDYQAICSDDTALLSVLVSLTSHSRYVCEHPADGPPQDLLLKASVLRI